MTYDELNKYILNYLENDKTNTAIMLTGGWGSGKSYYIQYTLKPFFDSLNKGKKRNDKRSLIIVSLYGIDSISELSSAIYLEARLKKLNPKSEKANAAIIVGKTIINNIANHYSIDLSQSDKDWERLYKSIDLSGKLLVLEDFERASINIFELLGYVNNLVSQDGVKVLLVTNELELAKQEAIEKAKNTKQKTGDFISGLPEEKEYKYTEEAKEYLRVKEKTIGDTINFEPDVLDTIVSIFKTNFENSRKRILLRYENESFADTVQYVFGTNKPINFRTFIYATQKFVEIVDNVGLEKYQEGFFDKIYIGLLAFSIKYVADKNVKWDGDYNYSNTLGKSERYPLFRFCYDYIVNQSFDVSRVDDCYQAYIELFNHAEILETFKQYAFLPEQTVVDRIEELKEKLLRNEISLKVYGEILFHLVTFEINLKYDMQPIYEIMINNAKGHSEIFGGQSKFYHSLHADLFDNEKMRNRYKEISQKIMEASECVDKSECDFSYNQDEISYDLARIIDLYGGKMKDKSFATVYDSERLADMFVDCSADKMVNIRTIFQSVYKTSQCDFDREKEIESITSLIDALKQRDTSKLDNVQKLQYNYFIKQLEEIITSIQITDTL